MVNTRCLARTALAIATLAAVGALSGFAVGRAVAAVRGPATAPAAPADARIPVRTADDLPRREYAVKGTAAEALADLPQLRALADQVEADLRADLAKYRIEDPTTLVAAHRQLQSIHVLRGELDAAAALTPTIRALEPKEADKLMAGVTLDAIVAAKKATGAFDSSAPAFQAAFKAALADRAAALPFETVKDDLIAARNTAKMVTRTLLESSVVAGLDPMLKANGGKVPQGVVAGLVQARQVMDQYLPLMPAVAEVYGGVIDAHAAPKIVAADSLTAKREIALAADDPRGKPVAVGVWDTGVDTKLFPGQLADQRGLSFDEDHADTQGDLIDLAPLKGDLPTLMRYVAASMDAEAGIETPALDELRAKVGTLKPDELLAFQQDMGLIGNYLHGTHVAGIAAAGNPFARLAYVRESYEYRPIPEKAPTVAEYVAWGESAERAVAFFKKADARVVNMSWRIPRAAVEAQLALKGVGKTKEERAELSRQIFAEFRTRLEKAIASAPDVLFVAGSGNESNDVDFSEYVPAGLRLPNLITVGAVDAAGRPTGFTSFGSNVELYANGHQVESVVPGGQRMRLSGTSMAAPQVANLAGKLFALDAKLTPTAVVALIRGTGTPLDGDPGRVVIDPKAAVAKLRAEGAR